MIRPTKAPEPRLFYCLLHFPSFCPRHSSPASCVFPSSSVLSLSVCPLVPMSPFHTSFIHSERGVDNIHEVGERQRRKSRFTYFSETAVYLVLMARGRGSDRGSSPASGPGDGSTSPPPPPHTAPASSHTNNHTQLRFQKSFLEHVC